MKDLTNSITYAVRFLNNMYGKGTVTEVGLFFNGGGFFVRESYGCKPERRLFRLSKNGKSVIALDHQKHLI